MTTQATASVPVSAELAPRLVARGIDVLLLVLVDIGLGQTIGYGFDWLALGTALVLVYFAALDTLFGATLGKAILGLRVIGPQGASPTFPQAVRRELFTVLGSVPLAGPLLALAVWIWLSRSIKASPLRQGRHDLFAGGTRVVRVATQAGRLGNAWER